MDIEVLNTKLYTELSGGITMNDFQKEDGNMIVEGYLHDELFNVKTGERKIVHNWEKNLIVVGFSKLVATLFKVEAGYSGLLYWGVGQGSFTPGLPAVSPWDTMSPSQRASVSTTAMYKLYSEIARVGSLVVSYLDVSNNPLTIGQFIAAGNTTVKLQIEATFGTSYSGYFREFGIFGGNANGGLNTGLMIDHKAHAVISFNIDSNEMVLRRVLRLVL